MSLSCAVQVITWAPHFDLAHRAGDAHPQWRTPAQIPGRHQYMSNSNVRTVRRPL